MANIDIAALRKMTQKPYIDKVLLEMIGHTPPSILDGIRAASDELDRLRAQRDALLAALEPIVGQLESAQHSTEQSFFKDFTMTDTESGALLRAIAAAKETP